MDFIFAEEEKWSVQHMVFELSSWTKLWIVNTTTIHYISIWNKRILCNAQLRHYLMSQLVIIANILLLKELEEKDDFKDSDDKEMNFWWLKSLNKYDPSVVSKA